ncbi:MAG: SpoIIIAH-like family protein [Eubacteriales bacterium]|nr:SpoIIIAH-like family protein [Eubacteriales bacterium]
MKDDIFKDASKRDRRGWARIGLLLALLVAAGILLWQNMPTTQEAQLAPTATQESITPQATATPAPGRTVREAAYDKDVAALEKLIAEEKTEESVRNQAAEQLGRLIENHQIELGVEEALTKAGFDPCMVLVQNDAMTVAVGAQELTAAQSGAILSVCAAHSNIALENIRIMTGTDG